MIIPELVDILGKELDNIYSTTNFNNPNVNEELTILSDKFEKKIITLLEKYSEQAKEYYQKREEFSNRIVDPVNEKVKDILLNVKKEYEEKFNDSFNYQVASSYSAKMNLIGESDIDYFILFKPLTDERSIKISQILTKYGFEFEKTMNPNMKHNTYYVFSTVIDNVEVEFKVRDYYYTKNVIRLHDYIDNKLDTNLKVLLTFAKYQLKLKSKEDKTFKGYNMFKTILYNYCFKDIEDAFYIIA
jgi:hypothetical protein